MQCNSTIMTSFMTSRLAICVSLLLLLSSASSADVQLTSNVQQVMSPLTQSLHIRCSVTDNPKSTQASSTIEWQLVGRRRREEPSMDKGADGKVTTTTNAPEFASEVVHDIIDDDDETFPERAPSAGGRAASSGDVFHRVASITITRDGLPVAAVSTYTPPTVKSVLDKTNVHIAGDVSKTSGELGYLELVWDLPTSTQAGVYDCNVHGFTQLGHIVNFSKTVTIQRASVGLDDLVSEILDLKKKMAEQDATNTMEINRLKSLLANETENYKNLHAQTESKLAEQQNELAIQKSKLTAQQFDISNLTNAVREGKHVETGSLHCGDSKYWTSGHNATQALHNNLGYYWAQHTMAQDFQATYDKPPVVFLSVSHLYVQRSFHTLYGVKLASVDNSGFSVTCGSGGSDTWRVIDLELSWIAVPV